MEQFLKSKGYTGVEQGLELNQFAAKPICFKATPEGAAKWNEVYKACINSNLNKLERAAKGSIKHIPSNYMAYDVRTSVISGVITISLNGILYVFRIGHQSKDRNDNSKHITSYEAFAMFDEKCEEYGIDLYDYEIENGEEVKKTIPRPYIVIFPDFIGKNKTVENAHHIDFHSSYASGLANTHPEFKPVVEFFYKNREEHPEYKDVLNFTIGYMQSSRMKSINARLANLSKDAIEDNNKRIDDLTKRLLANGNEIIGYNTDGIWYTGDVYHGEGEGPNISQWHNDHVNCLFRAKSSGAYEFIDEDGKYYPKMRGYTKLDQKKPREEWQWGDIFKTKIEYMIFEEGEGFVNEEE